MTLSLQGDCDMIELQTMNEIPIYTIIKIEAEEAEIPMLTFYVKEDSMEDVYKRQSLCSVSRR